MTTTSRSRRTSSHRKGDANELAILATAERLLAESPFSEISIADLAAGAGISRSSFYFYFGAKDEVLMTLFDRLAGELEPIVRAMAEGIAEDPRAGLGDDAGCRIHGSGQISVRRGRIRLDGF